MAATTIAPSAPTRAAVTPASRGRQAVSLLALAGVLAGLTWLWGGYRWLAWPQPGFIDHVLRYDGELQGDWHTSLPPVHWAMAHLYGLVPFSALETVVAISWVLYLLLLWGAFVLLCEGLGASRWTAGAAGAVAVTTGFAGVGVSGSVLPLFYPPAVSLAFGLAAIAALVRRRPVLAAGLLGLATLVHSNQGALITLACALPLAALLGRDVRRWATAAIVFGVPGLPSVLQAALGQTSGSAFDAAFRYDLFVVVRQPHHMLWSHFPMSEYVQTAMWTVVLVVAVVTVLARPVRTTVLLLAGSIAVLLAAGAVAGEIGRPLIVAMLQTSRLSALLVALGVAAGAALAQRVLGRWAPAALLAVLILGIYGERWWSTLADRVAPQQSSWITVSAACGVALGVVTALSVAWRRRPAGGAAVAAVVLAVVAVVVLAGQRDERVSPVSPADAAYADVADRARELSPSGTLVLTPPDLDGFRDLARRPVVVEFGTVRYADGDAEWVRRIGDVTGNDDLLRVQPYGTDVPRRMAAIAHGYDLAQQSPTAACRYGAKLVVTRAQTPEPRWLEPVYANAYYRLSSVIPGACG